jgi:N-acetylneuraminic acid mutarotase
MVAILFIASMVILAVYFPVTNAADYNPGKWANIASMPTARSGLGLVSVFDKIYAIGGSNDKSVLNTVEEYNPQTNTWIAKEPMPTARNGFAIAVYQNKIYVFGGSIGNGSGFLANNEVYDPLTNTWEQKCSMSIPRADLSACVVGDKIYLIGGRNYTSASPGYRQTDVNEVYDPAQDSWTRQANIPIAVQGYASAVMDNKIYIMGGVKFESISTSDIVNYNQVYNTQTGTWSTAANLPSINSYAGCAVTSGDMAPARIHILGGCTVTGFENKTFTYDPDINAWSSDTAMPDSKAYFGVAVVKDVLYTVGGFDGDKCLSESDKFTPEGYGQVPPKIEITSPESKTYREVSIAYNSTRATDWIGYSLDNKPNVTIVGETKLSDLQNGPHTIRLYGNDSLGNMGASNTVYFTIDIQGPEITIYTPQNSQSYGSTDVQVTFGVNENSTLAYSLDGREKVALVGNITLPAIPQGQHTLTIYATDQLGNVASKTVTFTIYVFPVFWIVGTSAIIIIILAGSYLLIKRKKIN